MKDFAEFEKYVLEHGYEVAYDTIHQNHAIKDTPFTEDELLSVFKMTYSTILSVLRQYHHWSNSPSEH